jgi:Lrp/AsnC family leucine-responsive transcriptional regulator
MIDKISLKILKILQKKARIPNVEVARQVKMAPSAVLERIRKLEKQGIIDGYEVRLNPDYFKRQQLAFVTITTEPQADIQSTGEKLARLSEVQEVHYIAGQDGFLIKVRVADTEALGKLIHQTLNRIQHVRTTYTTITMSTYKETAQIPIDHIDLESK